MTIRTWLSSQKTDDRSVVHLLIKGYFLMTLGCFLLLILPFINYGETALIDHIFFAVSIVSTTGLAPGTFTETYNLAGQIISLFFIQLGGVGYMALSSFIIFKRSADLPNICVRLLKYEFNLPSKYPFVQFIYSVFIFTLLIELIGAVFLYIGFRQEGIDAPAWHAIFHSVSAFCTAGFSLFGDSMTQFRGNGLITTTILILSLLGSIGFIVLLDFWRKLIDRKNRITLTSKIILVSTFVLWIFAAILIFISDSNIYEQGWQGVVIATFSSISAHTTVGFNNYDLGMLSVPASFILIILMIVGASPSGTGGGIKTTSISALFGVLFSILKRRKHVTFFHKEIPKSNVYLAISSAIFYIVILLLGTWCILLTDSAQFTLNEILFEAASALSTVGLSAGITGDFSTGGKVLISILMFIGRLGVLTFGFALINRAPLLRNKPALEDIAI